MGIPQGVSTMGTIANLLNTLNGIGVMSLELIQNASVYFQPTHQLLQKGSHANRGFPSI